jgi:hypothetical protein
MMTGKAVTRRAAPAGQPFILDHHADPVGGDQQQEQADTDAGTVGDAGGKVVQDPLAHAGDTDQVNSTHQEDGAQRDRNAQP